MSELDRLARNGTQTADRDAPILADLNESEKRLIREMRSRMSEGAEVTFKEDHEGELIAIESVLHRASDFQSTGGG